MKLRIGNAAILAYRRLPYRAWYAIAEFVDNSTDAYLRGNNKELLDKAFEQSGDHLEVEVTYDSKDSILRVVDNSIGMSAEELDQAMIIGERPVLNAGRSEFGMGMKTAAIWFADEIEIRTKKLGEREEVRTTILIDKFIKGDDELTLHRTPKNMDDHYTIIELRKLHRRLGMSATNKTKEFLGSIYRNDLRDGLMTLTVNGERVKSPASAGDDAFMLRNDGSKLVVPISDLEVNGKKVSGWIGVLKPGYTGRSNAGIALIRHGRTIRGWLDSWRPEEIFGDARNDTLNQRIAGELVMDQFRASHTKDAIDWENDDEEVLGRALKDLCTEFDLLRQAKKKTRDVDNEESQLERLEARTRLAAQMQTQRVSDTIKLLDVPKPSVAKIATSVLIEAVEEEPPVAEWQVGQGKFARLYEVALSPNDPYFEYEVLENADLKVVINSSHPATALLSSAEARLAHYHHVILDAVAEWTCAQQHEMLNPSSIRLMKDRLFRAVTDADGDL